MARAFDITAASDAARLDTKGQGEAAFTVSNVSGRRIRGRTTVVPKDSGTASWFGLAGDAERDFPAGSTQVQTVKVKVPASAGAGTYTFRLDVVSVDNPDEETAQGPSVGITVAAPAALAPPSHKLWLIPVILLILVIGGVAIYLVRPPPKPVTPPPPPPVVASFAGEWTANFARLALKQEGAKVTGEYRVHGGNDMPVKIAGTVTDRTLTGTFGDFPSTTPFSIVLDASNDTFKGTWGLNRSLCGRRSYPSELPAGCGFNGSWVLTDDLLEVPVELKQNGEHVTGTLTQAFSSRGGPEGPRLNGALDGHLRNGVLIGGITFTSATDTLKKRIRWTLMNQDFDQFQGIEFPFTLGDDKGDYVYPDTDTCGARKGSPKPQPCQEPSGLVEESFTLDAPILTDEWDVLDNAAKKIVVVRGKTFRATVTVKATTTNHVQVVGIGLRDQNAQRWVRVTKGFSNDVNPFHQVVAVQVKNPAAALLSPQIPYTNETVHLMIERHDQTVTLSYSPEGITWTAVQNDLAFPIVGSSVNLYALAYSNYSQVPLSAQFTDLKVTKQ